MKNAPALNVFITCTLILLYLVNYTYGETEEEMTVKVKPGNAECFYLTMKPEDEFDIEYQVINGEHGELDIDFFLYNSAGAVLKMDARESENAHRIVMSEAGDYKFCFDNTFSRISTKTVFFALVVTNPNEEENSTEDYLSNQQWMQPEDIYEMKVEDIKDALERIRAQLSKSRLLQDALSAHEARDRNIVENNYTRINTFSLVSVTIMVVTGIVQVLLLRSLFDDKSRLHRLWYGAASPRY